MKDKEALIDKSSKKDTIFIVDYNPSWVLLAKKEINILKALFSNQPWIIDIQHIGSTAIPDLAAKPIIDIYIGVNSIEEAQNAIDPIEKLGYSYWRDNPNPDKMFFVKGMPPFGT